MSVGNSTQATVRGTANGVDEVALAGVRITGLLTLGFVTANLSWTRKVRLKCMTIDPTGGASVLVTQLQAADEAIFKGQQALTANAGAAIGTAGVAGTEFGQSFTECATLIDGYCLPATVPLQVTLFNFSVATVSVSIMVSARTLDERCTVQRPSPVSQ